MPQWNRKIKDNECMSNLSLGWLDFDLLDKYRIWFNHHDNRCVGCLCNAADKTGMIVHLCPLCQCLTARARLRTVRTATGTH